VITETAWLLRAYPEGIRKLLASFDEGPLELAPLDETDLPAVSAILTRYKSLGIQLADASLLHLANREAIDIMFTLDRRDFSVLRLARGKKLRLIP
jgi:predicted nucleic acid-binding protein